VKCKIPVPLVWLVIPTKVPPVPRPTLNVEIPIKSSDILATYTIDWFESDTEVDIPFVETPITDPLFAEYINSSPVFNWWFGI